MQTEVSRLRIWVRRLVAVGVVAVATGAIAESARTQTPGKISPLPANSPPVAKAGTDDDYNRPVAYIYGNIPISRKDLGEFLMARGGHDKLDLLINKMVIEAEAKRRNITVTEKEIEAAFLSDVEGLQLKKADFVKVVLPRYGKTLYEWMEDVIRPRLLLTKMVQDGVKVTDAEIKAQFDREYGEKRDIQIIMWPKGDNFRVIQDTYAKARTSQEEFDRAARAMANPSLAATAGKINPISRNIYVEDKIVETVAFQLQVGEVSQILQTSQGYLVMKLHGVIPPNNTVDVAKVKSALEKQAYDEKLAIEIPKHFKKLLEAANPKAIYDGPPTWRWSGDAADATNEILRSNIQPAAATTPAPAAKKPGGM